MPLAIPLSKEQILAAQEKTKSNRAAARYLGVSYTHYKRYAKIYNNDQGKNLFDAHLNPHGKGIPKHLTGNNRKLNIIDVIEGRVSIEHFTPQKIRDALIREGHLKEECARCGMHDKRVSDYRTPLILNWKDGNKKNFSLTNIELLCYNCTFLYVGDIFTSKQLLHMEDYIPTPETQKVDWDNIDEHFEEHFKQLGLIDKKDINDGSEYISRLK